MPVLFPEAPTCTTEGCACPPTPETPYENWCCCPVTSTDPAEDPLTTFPCYYVMQPKCQLIPAEISGLDEDIASSNPCFINGRSYWTYKLFLPCAVPRPGLSHLVIPICQDIDEDEIRVFEKVDCCGEFRELSFENGTLDIKNEFQNHGFAPEFFNWLKINNEGAYSFGVCVTYLLSIEGNFQIATGPIELFQANTTGFFNCDEENCFRVPGCIPVGDLTIRKTCETIDVDDENNTATFHYTATIENTGTSDVTNIQFFDTQTLPTGTTGLSVDNETPNTVVGTIVGQLVTVTGPLTGVTLTPGDTTTVSYDLVVQFDAPGSFSFTNSAYVTGTTNGTTVTSNTAESTCSLDVVQVEAEKCCLVTNNNEVTFKVTISLVGDSPDTTVDISDTMTIPAGLTIKFTSFNGCTAVFADDLTNVPLNTNITFTADRDILITCTGVPVSSGSPAVENMTFTVVSTSVFNCDGSVSIVNTVTDVTPNVAGMAPVAIVNTISLDTEGLPATATVTVSACVTCQNNCALL